MPPPPGLGAIRPGVTTNALATAPTTSIPPEVLAKLQKSVPWLLMAGDLDGDGRLFLAEYQASNLERAEHLPQNYFQAVDSDHNGYIDPTEAGSDVAIRLYYNALVAQVPAVFQAVDRNHDGAITLAEWEDYFKDVPVDADLPVFREVFLETAGGPNGTVTRAQFEPMWWQSYARTSM